MMNLAEYRRKGTRLADYLPWAALVARGVVLNKDGSLQRSARFRGPDLDNAVSVTVVFMPFATGAEMGLSEERDFHRPWLMYAGTAFAHVMIPGQ